MDVQECVNCCIEVVKEAFDYAAELDKKWSDAEEKPPLYGIPFSVKGNFHMTGYDCSMGLTKFLDKPKTAECTLVTHLRNLGAIPFVITNVPEALMAFVCSNSIYGTTLNPHDFSRSPGGSTGGGGALLRSGGTPFSIASDLAGSMRIPAAFCGFVTLKPTQARLDVMNINPSVLGRFHVGMSFGFYTHTVDEQVMLLRTVIGNPDYRLIVPTSIPAPFNEKVLASTNRLRIGYYEDDGFTPAVPGVKRCVMETVEHLKREGHELVRFTIPKQKEMVRILYKLLMASGNEYLKSLFDDEIVDPSVKDFLRLLSVPNCFRRLASLMLRNISPQLSTVCAAYVSDLKDLRYTQEHRDDYKAEPDISLPVPAVAHLFLSRMPTTATYTALYNLLDFPAGAVPAGEVTAEDDDNLLNDEQYPVDCNIALKTIRKAAVKSAGLPLSVQVVTLPYEEEKCLRVMREVERIWSKDRKGSHVTQVQISSSESPDL